MKSTFRIAAAAAAAALALAARASDDPTQPEVANPAPAIALHGSGGAEAQALNADPTQARTEAAAPAVEIPPLGREAVAGAIVNDEPMASAVREAPAAQVAAK